MTKLNIEQIKKIIPHRPPILMIDEVVEFDKGKRVVAIKSLKFDDPVFEGHFPDEAVMPGTAIIEAMAQTSLLLDPGIDINDLKQASRYYLGSVKSYFKSSVFPGDQLRIESNLVRLLPTGAYAETKAYVKDKLAAEAEFIFVLQELSS